MDLNTAAVDIALEEKYAEGAREAEESGNKALAVTYWIQAALHARNTAIRRRFLSNASAGNHWMHTTGRGLDGKRDGCELCKGERGGVPGNENVINGVVVCDYCSALLFPLPQETKVPRHDDPT